MRAVFLGRDACRRARRALRADRCSGRERVDWRASDVLLTAASAEHSNNHLSDILDPRSIVHMGPMITSKRRAVSPRRQVVGRKG